MEKYLLNKDCNIDLLAGDDHYLYAYIDKHNQVSVEISNYDSEQLVYKESMHHFAWESLVNLAKQIIKQDIRIQKDLNE